VCESADAGCARREQDRRREAVVLVNADNTGRPTMPAEVLERLPGGVAYFAGPQHTVELATGSFRRLFGDRALVGLPVRDALPEAEGRLLVEKLDCVRRTGGRAEAREVEVGGVEGSAEPVAVDLVCEPVAERDGTIAGVVVQATEVTARVRGRNRLERLAADLIDAHGRYRTLFETMPQGVVYHDPDGAIIAANPAAAEALGVDADDLVGLRLQGSQWDAVREDGSAFPGDEHPAAVALRTGEVVPDVVMGVRHGVSGERRWLAVTAIPVARDETGRPQGAYAMFRDVTEVRRAARALRDRDALLGRLRDANVLGVALADEERVLDANGAFLEMVGHSEEDQKAGKVDWRALTPAEWAPSDAAALDQLRRHGACEPFEKELVHRSGRRVPVLIGAAVVGRDPLTWITFVADLSVRHQAEQERAKLVAAAHAARIEAKNAQERLSLLLGAGDLVAATHSRQDLLEQVTRLVVPAVADYAIVLLPTEDGGLQTTAAEAKDPAEAGTLSALLKEPLPSNGSVLLQAAFRTGQSHLLQDVSGHFSRWPQIDPRLEPLAGRLHVDSAIVVALVLGEEHLGVLALARKDDRPSFTRSDVAVAEELGRRVAVGLGNVDTFTREHSVSGVLQRSVLPDVLPSMPGVDLGVVYLPATEGVDVGGDWYDAFALGDRVLGIVIGDVVGHNLASASAMNQVRNAVRALAVDDPDPGKVLTRTNSALARLLPEALATVFYGVLDVGEGRLVYANAGHPPPVMTGSAGPRYLTGGGGLMLGVAGDASYEVATQDLPRGCGLLLYSDGLVEDRRRSIDQGLDTLAEAFGREVPGTAQDILRRAQTALLRSGARADDVCLLAMHLHE
jgi:PAS domain S-box-containing protein